MEMFVDPAPGSRRRWAIFVFGSMNFVISMFYRCSTAVISPALVNDLSMTSTQLSHLSAAFYYAFALAQIPLGVALDRIGPRRTMMFLAAAAVGGAVAFASARSVEHLILARALLGIGMCGNMMVLMTLLAAWFPVNRFAFLSGLAISVGALGNLIAATPLALLTVSIGWRASFLLFAAINAVVVTTFILVAKDSPNGEGADLPKPQSLVTGLSRLIHMYSYWAISMTGFVRYGYYAALQSLWFGPFLITGMSLNEIQAGNALLALGIGYMVGLPFWGRISDKIAKTRKWVVLPTLMFFCLVSASFLLWNQSVPYAVILLTFFVLGFTNAPGQILYAHIKELLPTNMIAQAMTSVNLFTMLGVGAMIHVLGYFLVDDPSKLVDVASFQPLWIVGVIALTIVCALYSQVPDSTALKTNE
jgi:MFS family permease